MYTLNKRSEKAYRKTDKHYTNKGHNPPTPKKKCVQQQYTQKTQVT